MRRDVRHRLALILAFPLALVLGGAASAQAEDKAACVGAHTRGQELRLGGHWVEAVKQFQTCSSDCPQPVTMDCARWYEELRALIPSIVVAATAPDGTDTLDVALMIDGKRISARLPSTSLNLDPGEHVIRLEHPGWTAVEQRLVLREREKDRRVVLRFAPPPTSAPPPPQEHRATSTFGIVMIAVGAAAAATGVTFGVLGKVREDKLAGSPCGKNGTCSHDDVDVVRQRYWTAGIAGGVGVVALAIGLYTVLARRNETASATGRSAYDFLGLGRL